MLLIQLALFLFRKSSIFFMLQKTEILLVLEIIEARNLRQQNARGNIVRVLVDQPSIERVNVSVI